ncbi:MAG: putative zinc-binding metallopeptidase [Candidatus Peregrinibacteria bacterium]|nr:putative zinc-binding metallopeptidase [Candidatus Peregrinibacteria bacterium]
MILFLFTAFGFDVSDVPNVDTPQVEDVETFHSAYRSTRRRSFTYKQIKPFPIIKDKEWDGHFSAKSFLNSSDKIELSKIKKSIKNVIAALPAEHLDVLEDLEIRNRKHNSRGMGNSKKIILNTVTIDNQKELMAVLIHEMGHVVDLGLFKGKSKRSSVFKDGKRSVKADDKSLEFYKISWYNEKTKKRDSKSSDFVSGYAKYDPFEDFAETYLFYRLHGEKFRKLAETSSKLKRKYNFMKKMVFDNEEFQTTKTLTNVETMKNLIFDATLLDFSNRDLIVMN